mgnify:CR=1 FL=1
MKKIWLSKCFLIMIAIWRAFNNNVSDYHSNLSTCTDNGCNSSLSKSDLIEKNARS